MLCHQFFTTNKLLELDYKSILFNLSAWWPPDSPIFFRKKGRWINVVGSTQARYLTTLCSSCYFWMRRSFRTCIWRRCSTFIHVMLNKLCTILIWRALYYKSKGYCKPGQHRRDGSVAQGDARRRKLPDASGQHGPASNVVHGEAPPRMQALRRRLHLVKHATDEGGKMIYQNQPIWYRYVYTQYSIYLFMVIK